MSDAGNTPDVLIGTTSDGTTIVTYADKLAAERYRTAMSTYDPEIRLYSAYLNDSTSGSTLTTKDLTTLGQDAQSNISNIQTINGYIRQYINTDDLIGMVVQSIQNNINTAIRLSYRNFNGARNKAKTLAKAQAILNDFDKQVDIKSFVRQAIITAYIEGNFASVLRNKDGNWQIDWLPLNIIEASGYEDNGNPILLVNIENLRTALNKTMIKNKRGQYLFFKDTQEEVDATFPPEVGQAMRSKETYAVLDTKNTTMIRVNNFGRKYGLSPIFRALSSVLMLQTYRTADETTAKSKAKKIIHQIMREKCLGPGGDRRAFEEMAYSHDQLMKAWKNNTVIVTTNPAVEKIVYVEPSVNETSLDSINIYRNKVLSSLGVAFLASDKSQTASTANINLSQLMKCINSISEQVERAIEHYYRVVLETNNIGMEYCPTVKIIDSEMLDMQMRMDLSKLLYTTFGASRETTFGLVGIDLEDERVKREKEESENLSSIFTPYPTSYNTDGSAEESSPGRPADSEDPDKQEYDQTYNETRV